MNERSSPTDGKKRSADSEAQQKPSCRRTRRLVLSAALICAVLLPVSLTIHAQQESQKAAILPSQQEPVKSLEEERLAILKSDIQKELEEFRKLKQDLDETKKALQKERQEQLVKVSKMYEAMPPEDAARRIERLDDDSALKLLLTLKPKTAGKILAQVETGKAAVLSKKLIQNK
ncbi:MAG TPA: hypothetical protein VLH56_08235 [Dissulfurispiraceae bacterium]|nr:hypothetical protein [Dissulfurispiraceae bacterium]